MDWICKMTFEILWWFEWVEVTQSAWLTVTHCAADCIPLEYKRDHSKLQRPSCSPHFKNTFPSAPVICTSPLASMKSPHWEVVSTEFTRPIHVWRHRNIINFLLVSGYSMSNRTLPLRKDEIFLSGSRPALLSESWTSYRFKFAFHWLWMAALSGCHSITQLAPRHEKLSDYSDRTSISTLLNIGPSIFFWTEILQLGAGCMLLSGSTHPSLHSYAKARSNQLNE